MIDTVTNEVINIMFVEATRATGDLRGYFSKILDLVEICHMGTLKKAEIEAVPNTEFILIQIALLSRREPSGDFRKL